MSTKRTLVVVATVLLLITSAADFVYAQSALLPLSGATSQGPLIERIDFQVLPNEAAVNASLSDGRIQAAEWAFSAATWSALAGRPGIISGVQVGYTFDGIGFNTLRPYVNSPHFRRAIEYLTDYSYLAKVVNSGPGGAASPYILPCRVYPGACYQGTPGPAFDLVKAANELLHSGLIANVGGNLVCYTGAGCSTANHITIQNVSLITAWYRHQNPVPGGSTDGQDCSASPVSTYVSTATTTTTSYSTTVKTSRSTLFTSFSTYTTTTTSTTTTTITQTSSTVHHVGLWSDEQKAACLFRPVFYYSSDDPLRSKVALNLVSSASRVGFVFDTVATSGNSSATILAKSLSAVISPGVYNPTTGKTQPAPVFDPRAVNSSDPDSVQDNWDLYTFSLTGSSAYTYQARLFNSAFVGSSGINFINYYNSSMDYWSNKVIYAPTASAARIAARQLGKIEAQEAPYVVSFYEGTRWVTNATGWTGFVSVPTTGPNTGGGLYYSSLSAHNASLPFGDGSSIKGAPLKDGTLKYGLGALPNGTGLDPLYHVKSASQTDIWGEVYNTPLIASAVRYGIANSFTNYMTTSFSVNGIKGATYTKAKPVNLTTGTGPGWFNMQNPYTKAPARIVNGMNISLTFKPGITWSDHVNITAADYNFSLYAWDLSSPPSLRQELTPLTGILSGPAGLWATHVVGNRIDIFVNSSSIWNLGEVVVPVLPLHIMKYFDTQYFATKDGAVDTSLPYESFIGNDMTGAVGTCPDGLCNLGVEPEWLQFLPNLEVGTGPFVLKSFNSINGSGELVTNPTFFNTNWQANATCANPCQVLVNRFAIPQDLTVGTKAQGANIIMSPVREYIYNPTFTTFLGIAPLTRGYVPITNSTSTCVTGQSATGPCAHAGINITSATFLIYKNGNLNAPPVLTGKLDCGDKTTTEANGECTATMHTGGLHDGMYEVIFKVTYTFLGLQRTWLQDTGFRFG